MKLAQIHDPETGVYLAKVENESVYPALADGNSLRTLLDYARLANREGTSLAELVERHCTSQALPLTWSQLNVPPSPEKPHAAIPVHPPEVWACGVTYKKSAEFRDGDTQASTGIYDYVYFSERPELFFKGTATRCTGPNDFIGIRKDSKFTAVEPELGVLLSSNRKILGFMVSNDVSAWDIERENPLYLPQSKIYSGCCSLGPVLLTADEVPDPYALSIRCEIRRHNQVIFSGDTRLSMMKRTIEELIDWLFYANPVPDGTVLLTGTGIIQTEAAALREGDTVEITIPEIGTLKNEARIVS